MRCALCGCFSLIPSWHSCNGGTRARRGLDPIRGQIGGFFISFGAPHTPVDPGYWRRFRDGGRVEDNALFQPIAGVPNNTIPDNFREASPTGKRGGREILARVPSDYIEANDYLTFKARETPNDARRVTRAIVDPWASTQGKVSWTPGSMTREAVRG